MINYNPQTLYDATDGGLKIISDFCPAAENACSQKSKSLHFRYSEERTPSAHLWQTKDGVWIIKDFSSGRAVDPIDVYCEHEGYDRKPQFFIVMKNLYALYGLSGEECLDKNKNKPTVDDPVPAPADMEEGEYRWSDLRPLNAEERKVMGKYVREDHAKKLNWYAVDWVGQKRKGMIKYIHSNESFPIFCRECVVFDPVTNNPRGSFFKFYEPLNPEKRFRFFVADKNRCKPNDYINNIGEYNQAYAAELEAKREDKDYKIDPFLEQGVVICCGERDALACLSMGWWPIWMNSETADVTEEQIRLIRRYNHNCKIYHIPDLDATGQKQMAKLANAHPDIWIAELPDSLKERKDNRGKPMKDLRDWIESDHGMSQWRFAGFMATAHRVQFWDVYQTKNGDTKVKLDTDCLHFMLRCNGIEPIYDDDLKSSEFGRHVNDYMIEPMDIKKVNDFVMTWAQQHFLPREVKNALLDGAKLDQSKLDKMLAGSYDFTSCDSSSQTVYFKDRIVEIGSEGAKDFEPKKAAGSSKKVWSQRVIDRNFRFIQHVEEVPAVNKYGKPVNENGEVLKAGEKQKMIKVMKRTKLFHYDRILQDDGQFKLTIDINEEAYKSPAFCVLCATSHIYWQDEQAILEAEGKNRDDIKAYWKQNWCRLDSPKLSEAKRYEQMASLISKLFIVGYYGWDFNPPSAPWAAFIMDDFDGEGSNGGSGKSLTFSFIDQYKGVERINGRKKNNAQDNFIFSGVTSRTSCVLFDDFEGRFSDWYQAMSSGLRIERKGIDPFTLAREKSPKLAFTTNGVGDRQSSSIRRQIRTTCSSFFHSEGNGFNESSVPADYCGNLWDSEYKAENWKYDDNVFIECIEEAMPFIKQNIKIEPPLERAMLRRLRRDIGKASIDFLDDYFRPGINSHANKFITRKTFVEDYKRALSGKGEMITEQVTLEKTAMWVAYRSWALAYCPKGVAGWTGDLKGEYRKSRIIQNSEEGIYIATIDNEDPNLYYLKEGINQEAVDALSKPELAEEPL